MGVLILEIAIAACLVVGGFFAIVGSFGLVKLGNSMARLHAPTKATTLGIGGVLIASMLNSFLEGSWSMHELLITLFLFITAPVSAHFIAKMQIHEIYRPEDLPVPPRDDAWASKAAPAGKRDEAVR